MENREKEYYKNAIIKLVEKIDNTEMLVYLFLFISGKTKRGNNIPIFILTYQLMKLSGLVFLSVIHLTSKRIL